MKINYRLIPNTHLGIHSLTANLCACKKKYRFTFPIYLANWHVWIHFLKDLFFLINLRNEENGDINFKLSTAVWVTATLSLLTNDPTCLLCVCVWGGSDTKILFTKHTITNLHTPSINRNTVRVSLYMFWSRSLYVLGRLRNSWSYIAHLTAEK